MAIRDKPDTNKGVKKTTKKRNKEQTRKDRQNGGQSDGYDSSDSIQQSDYGHI